LTKVYGAPGRFRREWARFERRDERLRAAGIDPVDYRAVRDGLSWKLPLMALLVFLHTYFEDPFWLYLLALASWGLVAAALFGQHCPHHPRYASESQPGYCSSNKASVCSV
jgi:hypothetical protein